VPEENPNFEHCQENRRRLRDAGVEVTELPFLPYDEVAGETVAASYLNFYICNGGVVAPVAGADTDDEALEIIARCYPGRRGRASCPGLVIAYGGAAHCITSTGPGEPWLNVRSC